MPLFSSIGSCSWRARHTIALGVCTLVALASLLYLAAPGAAALPPPPDGGLEPPALVATPAATSTASPTRARPIARSPVPPSATPTATPTLTLAELARQAAIIVEVTGGQRSPDAGHDPVLYDHRLRQNVTVRRWLKRPAGLIADVLGLVETDAEYARLAAGPGPYVLFLEPAPGEYACDQARIYDFFQLSGGLNGLFEIRNGAFRAPADPLFTGWTLDRLRTTIGHISGAAPPPLPPGDPLADVAVLAHQSDMIAEGDIEGGYGTAGGTGYYFQVRTWLKRPADVTGNSIDFFTIKGEMGNAQACRLSLGSGRFILFLNKGDPHAWGGADLLAGIYGVQNGVITFGEEHRYWGWTVARFTAAIQAALARPAPPVPDTQGRAGDMMNHVVLPAPARWMAGPCPAPDPASPAFNSCWQGTGQGITVSVRTGPARFVTEYAYGIVMFQGSDYLSATRMVDDEAPPLAWYGLPQVGPVRISAIQGYRVTLVPLEARYARVQLALDLATGQWLAPAGGWPWQWLSGTCDSPGGFQLISCWQDSGTRPLVRVQAGATARGGPARGVLRVVQGGASEPERAAVYPVPQATGPVRIAALSGSWVTLVPLDPHDLGRTFVFDLTTRRWVPPGNVASWQVQPGPCTGDDAATAISCWEGEAGGVPIRLRTFQQGFLAVSFHTEFRHAEAAHFAAPLDLGPVRIAAVADGRVTLIPLDPRFQTIPLVYDFVLERWLAPASPAGMDVSRGLVECGPIQALGMGRFSTCWTVRAGDRVVSVGWGLAPGSGAPILLVVPGPAGDPAGPARVYALPRGAGPVHPLWVEGTRLLLTDEENSVPDVTLSFDLVARRWIWPGDEPPR